jgi:hypothetical protein
MRALFSEQAVALMPSYLSGAWGTLWAECHGAIIDAVAQAMVDAIACSTIEVCPLDALPAHGKERGLERWPTETDPGYRRRLLAAPAAYAQAGTNAGLVARYLEMGLTVSIKANRDWRWDVLWDAASQWARLWVVVRQTHAWTTTTACGSAVCGTTRCAVNTSDADLRMLRGIALKWKGAHSKLVHVIIHISGPICGDATTAVCGTATCGGAAAYLEGD